jgi:putative lipoprotein
MNVTTAFGAIEVLGLAGALLAGCAKGHQGTTDAGALRGTVTYRERVVLPRDAVAVVRLSDVSRQDVAAPVIAETRVPSEGRQVPLPFGLRYDPKKIEPDRKYAIQAFIESGGKMLFTTDQAHRPSLAQGNPGQVNLQLIRVRASAGNSGGLVGTAWRLEDLGGARVLDRVEATLEFPEDGRAAGNGSCNRFFGPVRIEGESISFGQLASTRMACAELIGNQESKYLEGLQGAERFALDGATLSIYAKGMEKPLRFSRVQR